MSNTDTSHILSVAFGRRARTHTGVNEISEPHAQEGDARAGHFAERVLVGLVPLRARHQPLHFRVCAANGSGKFSSDKITPCM